MKQSARDDKADLRVDNLTAFARRGRVAGDMRYHDFLDAWRRSVERSRHLSAFGATTEMLDLGSMARRYQVRLIGAGVAQVEPYTISVRLDWQWDALQAARTRTTEEDVITAILGDADAVETEPPWLRVDIRLAGRAHMDAKLQLPEPVAWQRWALEISSRLEPLLPAHVVRNRDGAVLGWRGEPSVELRCGVGGELFLTGVEIEAWQAVELPRIWDDPERPRDPEVEPQLVDLAKRVRAALDVWADALRTLEMGGRVH